MAPRRWIEKAYKEMKQMGYSRAVVAPVLKDLLETYGGSYKLIEGEGFEVLVEALLGHDQEQERKKVELQRDDAEEKEEEETERLVKRSKRNNQHNRDSIPSRSDGVDDQPYNKPEMAESSYKNQYSYQAPSSGNHASSAGHSQLKGSHFESTDVANYEVDKKEDKFLIQLDYFEVEEEDCVCEPLLKLKRKYQQNQSTTKHYQNPKLGAGAFDSNNTVSKEKNPHKEPDSLGDAVDENPCEAVVEGPPLTAELDSDGTIHALSLPNVTSSMENHSYSEGNRSEFTMAAISEEENAKCGQDGFLKLDLASSSNGRVKISLMADSSLGPDFLLLENVIKKVEGAQTGVSVPKLMTDLCENFLAEQSRRSNEVLSLDIPNPRIVQPEDTNHQFSLCSEAAVMLNSPVKTCNVFEGSSHIPKSLTKDNSNLSCTVNLGECASGCNEKTLEPSPSTKMSSYIKDITKGFEDHEISLINEVSEDPCPTFTYMLNSMYVKFPLYRILEKNCCARCFGDCLTSDIPCACSFETGAEFAYKLGGLLKENFLESCIQGNHSAENHNHFYCQECPMERAGGKIPSGKCKGHVARKFIKECWHKCGCSMKCGNRVVQKGIKVKLQVFMTSGQKGWGVRVLEDVPKGSFICDYAGEVITYKELYTRNMRRNGERCTYSVVLDAGWKGIVKDEDALCLDATDYGNVARFINHRCFDANLVEVPVEVETPEHHYYHLAFFTTRDVNAFEELTWVI